MPEPKFFKIQKGVPFPRSVRAQVLDVLQDMQVGDCVDLPPELTHEQKANIYGYATKSGRKITLRKVRVNGQSISRMWRVE